LRKLSTKLCRCADLLVLDDLWAVRGGGICLEPVEEEEEIVLLRLAALASLPS
jgi:hypothetical protein